VGSSNNIIFGRKGKWLDALPRGAERSFGGKPDRAAGALIAVWIFPHLPAGGMQLVGRPFDEATVIGLGRAYQAVTDWHKLPQPLPP
jgi:hypothetical protein